MCKYDDNNTKLRYNHTGVTGVYGYMSTK